MSSGPRFFQTVEIRRPTVQPTGDLVAGSAISTVKAAIWQKRTKDILAQQGELFTANAASWYPAGTDIRVRDQVKVTVGQLLGSVFEVIRVVPGYDDRGREDHVGADLRSIDG